MKRKIGICFFAFCLFVIVGMNGRALQNEEQSETETDVAANTIVNPGEESDDKYIVFSEEGILVVYFADRTTFFFNSGVRADALPKDLQERLENGISFATEAELYEFLENYSS